MTKSNEMKQKGCAHRVIFEALFYIYIYIYIYIYQGNEDQIYFLLKTSGKIAVVYTKGMKRKNLRFNLYYNHLSDSQ